MEMKETTLRIFFENEEQKKMFDFKYMSFIKAKYPNHTVITDISTSQEITQKFSQMDYVLLDNFRQYLNKGIKTLGILMSFDIMKTKTGKFRHTFYFRVPGMNRGFNAINFDNTQNEYEVGSYYELNGAVVKDDYYTSRKTDLEIGFVKFTVKADSVLKIENIDLEKKEYDKPRHEFHMHTIYSGKDAFIRSEDLINANKWGKLATAAITDHGVVKGFPYIKNDLKDSELKLIFGMEAYMVDDTKLDERAENIFIKRRIAELKEINPDIPDSSLLNIIGKEEIDEAIKLSKDAGTFNVIMKDELKDLINDGTRNHITILCKTKDSELNYKGNKIIVNEGIRQLNKLITRSYTEGFSTPQKQENKFMGKRPCILKSWLMEPEVKACFVYGAACALGEVKALNMQSNPYSSENLKEIYNMLNFYDYFEIMPIHNDLFAVKDEKFPMIQSRDELGILNQRLYNAVKIWNENNPNNQKKIIFTSDAHLMWDWERPIRMSFKHGQIAQILKRTQPEKLYSVYDDFKLEDQPYVLSYDEMVKELKTQGFDDKQIEIIYNNEKILAEELPDGKEITIAPNFLFIPEFPGVDVKTEVPRIAREFAISKWTTTGNYDDIPADIKERLEYEITATAKKNYELLYYVARHSIKLSNEKGFTVGSRGLTKLGLSKCG